MITIKRFTPDQWELLKDQILNIENCFPEELGADEVETKKWCCANDAVVFLAFDGDEIVGDIYAGGLDPKDENWEVGEWDDYEHLDKKVAYIYSVAVLPDYRYQGIAKSLKIKMNETLKELGYDYVLGHSNEGGMTRISLSLGAKILKKEENICGSSETHYLTETGLKETY